MMEFMVGECMFILRLNFDLCPNSLERTTVFSGFPGGATKDIHVTHKEQHQPLEEHCMHKLAYIAGALAILSTPALAGSVAEKPMVLAEEGVSVSVGDRDHDSDRDRDHHQKTVVIKHHDRDDDHHRIVLLHGHHDHDDDHGDHDKDHH